MRRRRLNIRIALLLAAALLLAPAVLAASWYAFLRPDARRHAARGDVFVAAQQYRDADREYSAALRSRGDDITIVRKLAGTLERMPVDDLADADQTIGRLLGVYARWRELAPNDDEPLNRVFVLYERLGRECGRVNVWDTMLRDADAVLRSHPTSAVARKYRGIAQTQRMRTLDPPEAERLAAHDDLLAAMQAQPADCELAIAIATWRLVEARLLDKPGGDRESAKRWREIAGEFTGRALTEAPSDADHVAGHLSVTLEVGDRSRAVELADHLERALNSGTGSSSAAMTLAEARLRLDTGDSQSSQRVERAASVLHVAAKSSPTEPRLNFVLAQCEARFSRLDSAIKRFDAIAASAPTVPMDSVSMLSRAALAPTAKQWALDLRCRRARASAAEAWINGRVSDAVAALADVWRMAPSAESLAEYASALITSGEHAKARSLLEEQSAFTKGNPALLSLLAEACRRGGDRDESRKQWNAALLASRSLSQFSSVSAQIRVSAGVEEARSSLDSVAREANINSRWPELALIELSIQAGDNEGAIKRLDAVGELSRSNGVEALALGRLRGLANQRVGRFIEAEKAYRAVLTASPDDRVASNNLAFMLADQMNSAGAALPLATRLAERWRDDAQVLDTYGWVLFRAGKRDEAAAVLRRSVLLRPTGESLLHLAIVEESLGRRDESIRLLRAAGEAAKRQGDAALEKRVSDKLKGDPDSEGG